MWFSELCKLWPSRSSPNRRHRLSATRRSGTRLRLERLEDRAVSANFTAASVTDLIADINAANKTAEADTITLVAGKTFTLNAVDNSAHGATGLPVISTGQNLTIIGNGDTIERSSSRKVPAFRLFDVAAGATLSLQNLTLQGGLVYGGGVFAQGGAVYNQGAMTLEGVTVQNNTAQGYDVDSSNGYNFPGGTAAGGGVYSSGALTVLGCIIQNNAAKGGRGGDGVPISNGGEPGNPTSTPGAPGGDGLGGGLYVVGGTVTISSTTISENVAQGGSGGHGYKGTSGGDGGSGLGGGLYVSGAAGGTVNLRNVTVTSNTAQQGSGGGKISTARGIGGGLYIGPWVGLDAYTVAHVTGNHASTSDPDIAGSYTAIP